MRRSFYLNCNQRREDDEDVGGAHQGSGWRIHQRITPARVTGGLVGWAPMVGNGGRPPDPTRKPLTNEKPTENGKAATDEKAATKKEQ